MPNIDITRIASNIGAQNALKSLEWVNKNLAMHQERLSTGKRINNAADDPAGLTIATKLKARSDGLKVALGNITDAKNLLSVAEAGVARINEIMVEMKNKVSQGASDTMGIAEREAILAQLRSYAQQVDDIVDQTEWNGNKLIDGTFDKRALSFQTGEKAGDTTEVDGLQSLRASRSLSESAADYGMPDPVTEPIGLQIAVKMRDSNTADTLYGVASVADMGVYRTGDSVTPAPYGVLLSPDTTDYTAPSANGVTVLADTTARTGLYRVELAVNSLASNSGNDWNYTIRLRDAGGALLAEYYADTTAAIAQYATVTFGAAGNAAWTGGGWSSGEYFSITLGSAIDIASPSTQATISQDGLYSGVIGFTRVGDYDITTNGRIPDPGAAGTTVTTPVGDTFDELTGKMTFGSGSYLATADQFREYMALLEGKLNVVSNMMSRIGSFSGRLSFKEDQVINAQINTEASYSRIMNANMAEESVEVAKFQILQQTATTMLAQANLAPQFILSLFQ